LNRDRRRAGVALWRVKKAPQLNGGDFTGLAKDVKKRHESIEPRRREGREEEPKDLIFHLSKRGNVDR